MPHHSLAEGLQSRSIRSDFFEGGASFCATGKPIRPSNKGSQLLD
jgi:hypothetical protein